MSIFRFFGCVGKAIAKNGLRAVAGIIPMGDVVFDIASDAYAQYKDGAEGAKPQDLRKDVEEVAQAPPEQIQAAVKQVVQEVAGNQPKEIQVKLEQYLTQVPGAIHRSLRRPSDPSGMTVPPGLALAKPQDLAPLLPERLPRYKPGDKPIPGMEWVLDKLLGMGGFGEVWLARHATLSSLPPVVLKFCFDDITARSLQREAKLLDRLMKAGSHPGIVALRQTYLQSKPPALEYEYVEGGDLCGLLQDYVARGRLKPEVVARWILALARTIGFAHRQQPPVVHRDLKPSNILVQKQTEDRVALRVTDFGIGGLAPTQKAEDLPKSQMLTTSMRGSCTPLYASPEQQQGKDPDPRDDVHALGVIWYQLLTGDMSKGRPAGSGWKRQLLAQGVDERWLELLEACIDDVAEVRPQDAAVLASRFDPTQSADIRDLSQAEEGQGHPDQPVALLDLVQILERHRQDWVLNLKRLQETYVARSLARIPGTKDEQGNLIKPWLKAETTTPGEYVRVKSFDISRSGAVLNMGIERRVRLVRTDNGQPVSEVAGFLLDQLRDFLTYTIVDTGELNVPALTIKINKKAFWERLNQAGVLQAVDPGTTGYNASAEYLLRFDSLPLVAPLKAQHSLAGIFNDLADLRILTSIVSAHISDESDILTPEQIDALKQHYLSKSLFLNFPTVAAHADLEQALREGKVGQRQRYKIELGSREILTLSRFRSANQMLQQYYEVEREEKKIAKPTFAETLEGPLTFRARQLTARKKVTPADRYARPIFDDFLGLAPTGRATGVLEKVGADRLAKLIKERSAGHWPQPQAFVKALTDAQDRLEEYAEAIYRERLSPVVFYLGCTGRLPDHLTAKPPRTARQLSDKYEELTFTDEEEDGKFYEVDDVILGMWKRMEYYSKRGAGAA